ncbi:MAG: protein kinase domain-containing protein [Pseudomonadota bacterium]
MDARALALLERALAHAPERREAFVRDAAGDDAALLGDALALLVAHRDSTGLMEAPTQVPERLGAWRLGARIGQGGMGEVFLAERDDGGFHQRAALKLVAVGGAAARARFEAERAFLARLEHPRIARVIDGGSAPDGRPWVAMEYVDGEPIDRWCAREGLDLPARVRLFLQVLDAVGAAHRALVLHRDIKPSNVLVDAAGGVKLLDFGIAKSLAGADGALTATGLGPLTPQYASPEQIAGRPLTTASDVYALGLLLHELLTGRRPFDYGERSLAEIDMLLRTSVPSRPSATLDAAALRLTPQRSGAWRRRLQGDLDRVLLKALAVDVERRYADVAAFEDDLRRWLEHRPVQARSGDRLYRARLFLRRNRLPVAAGAAAFIALAVGLAVAAQQARRAEAQAARAEAASRFLMALVTDANPVVSGREPTLREAIDQAVARIPKAFAGQPEGEAEVRLGIGAAYTSLMQLDAAQEQLARALALRRPGSAAHAEGLQALAGLEWTRGRTDAAESNYRAALAVFVGDPSRATDAGAVRNDLAALMSDVGRYADAVPLAEAAVANARALSLGPGVLGARLENLGSALQGAGRLAESERAYREAIVALEQALPQRTVALAVALNNFALVFRDQGRRAEALDLFERAVAVRTAAFGEDHADNAGPLANAARMRVELGDVEGARRDIARALALAERAFAPDYVGRGHVHLVAAQVALAAGERAAARTQATEALAVFSRADAADPAWSERAQAMRAAADAAVP